LRSQVNEYRVQTGYLQQKGTQTMSKISDLSPGTWNVDASHSSIGFSVRHLMVSKVRGRFGAFSGAATIAANPLESHLEATVDLGSVDTSDVARDEHLRGADFFDVEHFPTMTLKSTKIVEKGGDYELTGDLTIKGVTRSVTFELEFEGTGQDPWGATKAGFSAETEINRKEWGLEWNVALEAGGVLVGEKVKIQLDVQLVKA
jgi:polyisoprenoid-binding protein YceI